MDINKKLFASSMQMTARSASKLPNLNIIKNLKKDKFKIYSTNKITT